MTRMTGGRVVVESLAANGAELVFGIPGTHSLPIYVHLGSAGIRHVNPRHEQGAGYAADGFARSSGRPGVCLVTTGPGVTNIATAIGQAYSDSIPLLVVSPGMPASVEGGDHGYLHEAKNQIGLTGSIAAWSHRATTHQDLADSLQRAFEHLGAGRRRPVHIEAPLDILAAEGSVGAIEAARSSPPRAPEAEDVDRVWRMLAGATRLALVLGGGARGAAAAATELAERAGMIAVTTTNGKGVVSERHRLSVGATVMTKAVKSFVESCDVVVAVGTELGDSDLWGQAFGAQGSVVRIDVDPAQLQKNLPADVGICADARLTLEALAERARGSGSPPAEDSARSGLHAAAEAAILREAINREMAAELSPFRELVGSLEKALDPAAIIAGDAAMACYYGGQFLLLLEAPSQWLYPTGFCTLGYGLPAAIGAKLAHPDREVVALMGDGGAMFTLSELATAVQLQLALPLVVVTNGGYGEIRREIVAMGAQPVGTDFAAPDFVTVAKGLGAHGVRVDPARVGPAVEEAFGRRGPTLVEVAAG